MMCAWFRIPEVEKVKSILSSIEGFLELWRPLLPNWILQYILDQMVLIRLQVNLIILNFILHPFIFKL